MSEVAPGSALITGATSGIGHAVARRFRAEGWRAILVARGEARLASTARSLEADAVAADVSVPGDVARLETRARDLLGGAAPDVVINCAGSFLLAPFTETDTAAFDAQIAANLRAPFLVLRAFLPAMLERGTGHLITIGSVAGRTVLPHNAAYAASKFGVRGLHGVLAAELRGTGVRATLIEPAATDTALWDPIDPDHTPGLPPRAAMLPAAAVADAVWFAATRDGDVAIPNLLIERS